MTKDIKDYLHLYIGCDVKRHDIDDYGWKLVGVSASEVETDRIVAIIGGPVFQEWYVEETLPILRPLSDMTEEEAIEFCIKEGWGKNLTNIVVTDQAIDFLVNGHTTAVSRFTRCRPEMFHWLLSKGFDLFGLIESGLAIDKTTI